MNQLNIFADELVADHRRGVRGSQSAPNPVNLVNLRSSQLRLQVDKVDSITISVISSKTNVTVAVQNSVVRFAKITLQQPHPLYLLTFRASFILFAQMSVEISSLIVNAFVEGRSKLTRGFILINDKTESC